MAAPPLLRRLAHAALAVAAGAGCAADAPAEPPTSGPNVVLVVVDTLRADHLGCYGAERPTSPAIDALAARGVRFERAYTAAPWTMPSVASLLSGLWPEGHGATHFTHALPADVPVLPEVLGRAGYATGGVVSGVLIGSRHGFDRGFETFSDDEAQGHDHRSTPGVTRRAVELLERLAADERPFFLLVHYFDPHENYRRHPDHDFAPASAGRLDGDEPARALRELEPPLTADEVALVRALYDEEIRGTDEGVGALLERLAELGLEDETLVALTADHGEEFLERGWLGHVTSLRDELVRVPLLLAGPGLPAGHVVETPVSTVSLAPTVLELLGLGSLAPPAQAPSLAAAARGAEPPAAPAFLDVDLDGWKGGPDTRKEGVVLGRHKLVRDLRTGAVALFDLADDPEERRDLADERPEVVARLLALLERHGREAPRARAGSGPRVELGGEDVERLRGLGYVGGG